MSDIVRPCCWICVPKCSPPETLRFEVGFGPFGGQMQGWKQHFGPRLEPSLAILGPVKVSGGYSYASWSKVGGSWGQVGLSEVVFKVSWKILFGHFVAFAARNALPQQDQDFKWVSASYAGSIWVNARLSYGPVGAILGPISVILGLCWRLYGIILEHTRKQPQTTPPKRFPQWPSRRNRRNATNQSKTKISSKTLIPMADRPKRNKKHPKIRLQKINPNGQDCKT